MTEGLTDSDHRSIDRARQLAEAVTIEAVREAAGDPGIDTYAEAYGVARVRLGDLLAIIGRLEARNGSTP